MNFFERLFYDQRFDEWASKHSLLAARVLNQAAADLILQAEHDLKSARWKDGLIDPNAFLIAKISTRIQTVADPLAKMLIEEANRELQELVGDKAIWSRSVSNAPTAANSFESVGDLATIALPLGAGAAAALALPSAAVTTSTAYFGLVTTTIVSWPVLLGGAAVAGLGITTGLIEGKRLWSKVEGRLRVKTRNFVIAALVKGSTEYPAVLEQLTAEFWRTAERARSLK
jgi:hypothetical protein